MLLALGNSISCTPYPSLNGLCPMKITNVAYCSGMYASNCFQFLWAFVCHEELRSPFFIPLLHCVQALCKHFCGFKLRNNSSCNPANSDACVDNQKETWKAILSGLVYGIHACYDIAIFRQPLLLLWGLHDQ